MVVPRYYEATVDEITSDGQVCITFVDYKDQSEVTTVNTLKEVGSFPLPHKKPLNKSTK